MLLCLVLIVTPNDEDAVICKSVALIQSGDIEGATKHAAKYSSVGALALHRAYLAYRNNQCKDALNLIKAASTDDSDLTLKELTAQTVRGSPCLRVYCMCACLTCLVSPVL